MAFEPSTLSYRRDIDGLRAVAIALVLAYHVAPTIFPGGFVGVDVFFVLSGYLITKILVAAPGQLGRFYGRRARRLAPALLVVLAATLVLGQPTLLAHTFRQLAEHTVAAALFAANIVFWLESGYFDAAAIDKPLLHLWSLGLEEQFYLFWPLTLWWALRRPQRARWLAALLAVGSFLGCVWIVRFAPDTAFFLPWYRMWEPLSGALLALSPDSAATASVRDEGLAWGGAGLIAASAFLLGGTAPFPTWTALAPVLGTVMLIWTGEHTRLARSVLSRRPMVALGLISYPLYLWHWPLISLFADPHPTDGIGSRAVLCVAAVGLATSTYHFVERPIRSVHRRRPVATVVVLSSVMVGLTLTALGLARKSIREPPPTFSAMGELQEAYLQDSDLRRKLGARGCEGVVDLPVGTSLDCLVTGTPPVERPVVLWGDSSAVSWAPLVQTVSAARGLDSVVLSFSGCPPLLGVRSPLHQDCELDDGDWKLEALRALNPSHIVLSARWSAYSDEMEGSNSPEFHYLTLEPNGPATRKSSRRAFKETLGPTLERLAEIAPVTIIAAPPDLLRGFPRGLLLGLEYRPTREEHEASQRFTRELLAAVPVAVPLLGVIDPAVRLCASGRCEAILDGTVVYQDDNHVTAQGALLFQDLLGSRLDSAIPPQPY